MRFVHAARHHDAAIAPEAVDAHRPGAPFRMGHIGNHGQQGGIELVMPAVPDIPLPSPDAQWIDADLRRYDRKDQHGY